MNLAELIRKVRNRLEPLDITEVGKDAWKELMKLEKFLEKWGIFPSRQRRLEIREGGGEK